MMDILITAVLLITCVTMFIFGYKRIFQTDVVTGLMYIALGTYCAFWFSTMVIK